MSKRDYYEILGLSRTASKDELKRAYRKLAMKYHPDRNPNNKEAEKSFKEINEAYDVLKEDEKRAAYDRFGHQAFAGAGHGHESDFSSVFDNINDIFEGFMGGGRQRQPRRGRDIQVQVHMTLEQAYHGHELDLSFPRTESCETCDGSGRAEDSSVETCRHCGGRGRLRMQQAIFTVEQTCSACGGAGETITNPCRSCRGQGIVQGQAKLKIRIPPGIDQGGRIRVPGKGEVGPQGVPPGDLYVLVEIDRHSLFERDGDDLHYMMPIGMIDAALGTEVKVPTPGGETMLLKIPQGTQPGTRMRLRGKGMPVLNSGGRCGYLYVKIAVEIPVNLNESQREELEELKESLQQNNSPDQASFFNKAKNFWQRLSSGA